MHSNWDAVATGAANVGSTMTTYTTPSGIKKQLRRCALNYNVLAVAVYSDKIGDWKAYISAVPGKNHDAEQNVVAREGAPLRKDVAALLFPDIAAKYKWRE